ncbi:amine dehydrogenase large subunit [Celeribacter sp.]|uniref:amine dehydrogenase large subunit n=1 Tax=Celeribacter sp. TaxID=1890673 RepID=UPI003A8E1761
MGTSNFSEDFKRDSVHQIKVRVYPVREVSERLGVSTYSLYTWMKHCAKAASQASSVDYEAENRRLTCDGARIYSASHYFKRIISGPDDPVLAEWDTQSLTLLREIPISDRLVMATNQPTMVALTADEKFVLIQYATPATSVGVVSLEEGKHIAEIPTPGCWTIMPAAEGLSFSTVCGDGTLASYTFEADGSFGDPIKTPAFFDPETDPIFTSPATAAGKMIRLFPEWQLMPLGIFAVWSDSSRRENFTLLFVCFLAGELSQ